VVRAGAFLVKPPSLDKRCTVESVWFVRGVTALIRRTMQEADDCVSDHDFVPLPPCKNDSATAFYLLISESLFFLYIPGAQMHLHVRLDTAE